MPRDLPEWIGATPDAAIPRRVKLRLFHKYEGRCAVCTLKVGEGQRLRAEFDHIVALVNGGEHRESNLRLVCTVCHKVKTARDVAEKGRRNRRAIKRNGLGKRRTITRWRKFDGTPVYANRDR